MSNIYDKSSLVLIPSGTKTGKVFSQKPVSGDGDFTFTRASAATRVNADGNIEKETNNQLLQSNSFITSWTGNNSGITGGQAGYDGTNNASIHNASGGYSYRAQFGTYTGVNTFSIYAKAGTAPFIRLYTSSSPSLFVNFDLVNGTIQPNVAIDSQMIDVGNGWYRCSMTFNATNNNLIYFYCAGANGDVGITTTGDNIYIQDAQLEQGLVARDVITTTTAAVYGGITDNTPRLDYTDSSCPALLLEPLRTNNVPHSEYHQGTIAAVTRTYNTSDTLSPEGVYNAVKYEVNANNSDPYLRVFNIPTSGNSATFSLYVKGASGQLFSMILGRDGYNELEYEAFSLDGTWQRLDISKTFTTTPTTLTIGAEFSHSSDDGVLGQEYYLYGLQVEAASYATSYIPTYGSSVSRVLDSLGSNDLQASGVTNNSTGWTYIVKGTFNGNGAAGNNILVQRDEGGFFYRYGSSFGFSGATKGYWTEFNPNGGFAYIWDGTQLRVRRGGSDIRTISAADIGWSAGGTSNWTINYVSIARVSFELENAFIFNQALTNEEIDSLV